jgi:hypothetical protein
VEDRETVSGEDTCTSVRKEVRGGGETNLMKSVMVCTVAGQMEVGVKDVHVVRTGAEISTVFVLGNLL